jgi:hypothetical protein
MSLEIAIIFTAGFASGFIVAGLVLLLGFYVGYKGVKHE